MGWGNGQLSRSRRATSSRRTASWWRSSMRRPTSRRRHERRVPHERRHASDIGAMAAYLKKQAAVPVWLVGTSMGTFSAAGGAIAAEDVDGLVLTSTITRSAPDWKIARSHPRRRREHGRCRRSKRAGAHRVAREGWLRASRPQPTRRSCASGSPTPSRWRSWCSTAASRRDRSPARRSHSTVSSASRTRRSTPSPGSSSPTAR